MDGADRLTLGHEDRASEPLRRTHDCETCVQTVASLPGATRARPQGLEVFTLAPEAVVSGVGEIVEALAELAEYVRGSDEGR